MGCDGGTTSRRDDLVKAKKIVSLPKSITERYTHCSLSQQPFTKHVVCDRVGRLYNRESILRLLIRKEMPDELRYIATRKDVMNLTIEWSNGRMICPLKRVEFNEGHQFVALSCGCVCSKASIDEMKKMKETRCPLCDAENHLEYILLNPDVNTMNELMKNEQHIFDQHQYKKKIVEKDRKKEDDPFIRRPIPK